MAQGVLPGPEAAAKAAAAAPNKKRQQAEAAITQAVADALHLISRILSRRCVGVGVAELLQQVLALEVAWNRKDADSVLALTQLIEAGYTK